MHRTSVLVVEDERVLALVLRRQLESLGYLVCGTACAAKEAIELAELHRPSLALMDIVLDGPMDGIAAATYLWKTLRIPVVFTTAHTDEQTLARAKRAEPFGFLVKPFQEADLHTGIEIALTRASLFLEIETRVDPDEGGAGPKSAAPGSISSAADPPARRHPGSGGAVRGAKRFLRQLEIFAPLPEEALNTLARELREERVCAGQLLTFEGERRRSGFIVREGRVAMLKSTAAGKELMVALLPPGDPLGLIAALDDDAYPLTARAQSDTRLYWLPKHLLRRVLQQFPEVMSALMTEMCARLRNAHNVSRHLAFDKVEVRVAQTLCRLVPRFAEPSERAQYRIQVSRRELAELTAATPETISRITRHMEREGLLRMSAVGEVDIVDLQALRSYANDCSTNR